VRQGGAAGEKEREREARRLKRKLFVAALLYRRVAPSVGQNDGENGRQRVGQNDSSSSFVFNFASFVALLVALSLAAPVALAQRLPKERRFVSVAQENAAASSQTPARPVARRNYEYLWYETENMQGFSTDARNWPVLNPSWRNTARAQSPGWGINGPGVSAEWTQGGESEWNSAAASFDETKASIYQDVEVGREGRYRIWVRYADWAQLAENFTVRVLQGGREVLRHEFGARDLIDPHDEVSMYWGWAFAWDASPEAALSKGAARISIDIERAAGARRHVDCILLTNDADFVPEGRRKPDFAAMRYLREWAKSRPPLAPLLEFETDAKAPSLWRRPTVNGREFMMPWNISKRFWELYERPPAERPLYPFHTELVEQFVEKYKGARDVPLFSSKLVVPVIYINDLPQLLKEGSPFLKYLRDTRSPFAVLINYGSAQMPEAEGQAAWKLLSGELSAQFVGWISGENIGYVNDAIAKTVKLTPSMSRREMLETLRAAYTAALEEKWRTLFHAPTGAMWDKLIAAQATSSTTYAHALGRWGSRLLGMETAAVMPNTAMRIAFTRGAARQSGGAFLYYHAPNFGDTATTFTKQQNFAGPDHFHHSRYGATMGPSLSWYRKNYYLYFMSGASAIYLEQGFDQFFKPGPGDNPLQLNPLGRITEEFMRFAETHVERGTPYTPVAILLDPAHGWDITDYPQRPFGVSLIDRHDRALRELFGAAYYPAPVDEGEPATADRQAFTNALFGDIFDVLVASEEQTEAIDAYRALVVGGRIEWGRGWPERLKNYVRRGGTVVVNAAQAKGLPEDLLGVRLLDRTAEADDARCLTPNESATDLSGQVFRYTRVEPRTARPLIETPTGDALVTVNQVGRGRVVFCAVPDLLGLDERITPHAAHLFVHLFAQATPVRVGGDIEHLLNRTARGWVVTLINNRGVYKPQQGLAGVNRNEAAEVSIDLRGKRIASAQEWTTGAKLEIMRSTENRENLRLSVPPGGVRIVEIVERP
jgi:hypothetical protein